MSEIKINNLSLTYHKRKLDIHAIADFSYTFEGGKSYAILGGSGSGKTSLLRAISGIVDYEGMILIDGKDAFDLTISERNFALVSQNFTLYPHLNIFFNIAFPLKNMDYPRDQIEKRVYEIADILGISHCLLRKPKELSTGQQQRVALARALIKMPSVLLLDEPLSNVDPQNKMVEINLIKSTCQKYLITLIYVTHNFTEAINIADYILVMDEGKLVYNCTKLEALTSDNPYLINVKREK